MNEGLGAAGRRGDAALKAGAAVLAVSLCTNIRFRHSRRTARAASLIECAPPETRARTSANVEPRLRCLYGLSSSGTFAPFNNPLGRRASHLRLATRAIREQRSAIARRSEVNVPARRGCETRAVTFHGDDRDLSDEPARASEGCGISAERIT